MPSVRLILFDLDGTLADTGRDLADAANFAAAHVAGLPPQPVDVVTTFIGDGARMLVQRCLEPDHVGRLDEALAVFLDEYARHLLDYTRLYPGVRETLAALGTIPMAVLTNKPEGMSRTILDGLGIALFFRAVIGGDTHPTRKPDPAGALALCADLGAAPGSALLVGDSATDVLTGKAAGIPTVGVTGGFGTAQSLVAAGADHLIPRIGDLAGLVARLSRAD